MKGYSEGYSEDLAQGQSPSNALLKQKDTKRNQQREKADGAKSRGHPVQAPKSLLPGWGDIGHT